MRATATAICSLEVFYDDEGRAILSDGRPCPPRPAALPELAQFDETRGGWALRSPALDRFWTAEGALVEEDERAAGRRARRADVRRRGRVSARSSTSTRTTGATGPFLRRLGARRARHRSPTRACAQERGSFELGQAVGTWTFLDADGAVVRTVERGRAFPRSSRPPRPRSRPSLERRLGARAHAGRGGTRARGAVRRGARRRSRS